MYFAPPANEWLDPKKEATLFEVAFLVSATPPPRNHTRVGYLEGSGGLSRNMSIPRQLALGEVIGQKKGKAEPKPRPVSTRSSKAGSGRRIA